MQLVVAPLFDAERAGEGGGEVSGLVAFVSNIFVGKFLNNTYQLQLRYA